MTEIAWMGSSAFQVSALKTMFDVTLGKMLQSTPSGPLDQELPYLNSASIQDNELRWDPNRTMWVSPSEKRSALAARGDLMICEGGDVGRAAFVDFDEPVAFQNSVHRARAIGDNDVRYLRYVLVALRGSGYLDVLCNKATIRHLTSEKLANLSIPSPSAETQRRIADFLDTETARLDALATHRSRQRDLLDRSEASLLAEISQNSGPQMPVKRVASRITSGPRGWGELVADRGVPFLRITNVPRRGVELLTDDVLLVDAAAGPERERTRTRAGDVLVTITADIGSVGIVRQAFSGANVNQHIALVRPDQSKVIPDWLAWQLKAPSVRELLTGNAYGGTKVGLGLTDIANVTIPVPAVTEQERVLEELRRRTGLNSAIRSTVDRQIALLRERRQALITAAVTGLMDVTTARGVDA